MTELLTRLFVRSKDEKVARGQYISMSGTTGIVCNLLLFLLKTVMGIFSGSMSVIADAMNNLTDAFASVLTLIGLLISRKKPDRDHPFGHARIEYLTGLCVALFIFGVGIELGRESFFKILQPAEVRYSPAVFAGLCLSILFKLWLSRFYKKIGKKIDSPSLLASASDSRNDVIATSAVLLGALVNVLSGINPDGYLGLAVAIFILFSGFSIMKETSRPLIGGPAQRDLVLAAEKEILEYSDIVLGIHDLIVHDYGPGQRFATVHAEIDRRVDVMEAHDVLDDIERDLDEKMGIHLVIHYDPVVTDDDEINETKAFLEETIRAIDPRLSMHDFRMVRGAEHTKLIFDLVLPFALAGKEAELKEKIDRSLSGRGERFYTVIRFDSGSYVEEPKGKQE